MNQYFKIAQNNQKRAWEIVKEIDIVDIWKSIGADAHLVGSLRMGLLMNHLDIDFHIYSDELSVVDSFSAVSKLAKNPSIERVEYMNLINTDEHCIEWHAWFRDTDDRLWQIDMIHILRGSTYCGYFEKVADRVVEVLTFETKNIILKLKYQTSQSEKIMGIEYCQAVLSDGVKDFVEFTEWRKEHPVTGIVELTI